VVCTREQVFIFTEQSSEKGTEGMKTFEVQFRYVDRNEEKLQSTVIMDASNLPGAIGKAARQFVKGLDRKQRFDMNKNGLEITAKHSAATTESQSEKSAEAAAG
jgi:hypothetical protein